MAGLSGILLIVALIGVSGVIAYVGDIVGRRMGRKRLTLFGMRPRHTAIAISVVAGMCITIVTLAVAMGVSTDVREGFLRVEEMRRRQAQLTADLDRLSRRLATTEQSRAAAERELQRRRSELDKARRQLQAVSAELAAERKELGRVSAARAEAEAEVARATLAYQREAAWGDKLRLQNQSLQAAVAGAIVDRTAPVLFGAQQPLAVRLMEGGRPTSEILAALNSFVEDIDAMVRAAGARPARDQSSAVIIRKPVREGEDIAWATKEQVLEAIAERLRDAQGPIIVRAFSVFNTHADEPVYVDFELFRNQLVFRRGDSIAETIIDGRLSEPAILSALVGLLRDQVGAAARGKNVMPRITTAEPSLFSAPRGAVGEMSFDDLFAVVGKLRQTAGPARVRAVAASDTWTIGPLEVDLLVEPLQLARGG